MTWENTVFEFVKEIFGFLKTKALQMKLTTTCVIMLCVQTIFMFTGSQNNHSLVVAGSVCIFHICIFVRFLVFVRCDLGI